MSRSGLPDIGKLEEIYLKEAPLAWHLKILLSRVTSAPRGRKGKYEGIYRRVRRYDYYEMGSRAGTMQLPPPKFENFQSDPQKGNQRGAADTWLALASKLSAVSDGKLDDFVEDFTIKAVISDVSHGPGTTWTFNLDWDVHDNVEYRRFVINVSGEAGRAKKTPEPVPVLVSSDTVAEAFEKMADLWHRPGFENFLIVAPPGAGKDVLVNALAAGLQLKVVPLVLGREPVEAIEAKLFGSTSHTALLKPYQKDKKDRGPAQKALIFLDEVDKTTDEARGLLLRLLESKDYLDGKDGKVHKLRGDLKFGFAGSKSRDEMMRLGPRDFWTRIQTIVDMGPPLPADSLNLKRVLESYFTRFWDLECDKASGDPSASEFEKNLVKEMRSWATATELAGDFAKVICSLLLQSISVRTLRTAVQSVFHALYSSVLQESNLTDAIKKVGETMQEIIVRDFFRG